MKFYALIAAGTWMNLLGFEADADQSHDPGSGHGFKIGLISVKFYG